MFRSRPLPRARTTMAMAWVPVQQLNKTASDEQTPPKASSEAVPLEQTRLTSVKSVDKATQTDGSLSLQLPVVPPGVTSPYYSRGSP